MPVAALPNARGDGVPVTTLVDLSPAAAACCITSRAPGNTPLLVASTAGYGFIAKAGDMVSRNRKAARPS